MQNTGSVKNVTAAAEFLGITPGALRKRIERRTVPFRKLGGRVVFLEDELRRFLTSLDGCAIDEAIENVIARSRR